jgi:hypothetical protein
MKVKELISVLEYLDGNLEVYLFQTNSEIIPLEEKMIDTTISDRVDINLPNID